MSTDNWITAVLSLRKARHVAVFSGAGISAESGIPTFRDTDGFWEKFPPEEFANWEGLLGKVISEPRRVAEFAWHVIDPIARAQPNVAHYAAAEIQRHTETTIITQNIDGLHQAAGASRVLELHGSLLEVINVADRKLVKKFDRADLQLIAETLRAYADKEISLMALAMQLRRIYPFDFRGRHQPNLVLFGDAMAEPDWTHACTTVEKCDVLISIGTSGSVYPAAFLPGRAELAGATVISISPRPCDGCWLEGSAGEVLPLLVSTAWPQSPLDA